jgi:phosphoribosylformimino-5-aminoimidazole carboxamide ribotide isomerase
VHIIGVIDLKDGKAVHARGGRRETYAPVAQSAGVSIDGNAVTLARAYVEAFGLDTIYVADLNAIAGDTPHDEVVRGIGGCGASLMVDAGVRRARDAQRIAGAGERTIVVGLETLQSFDALSEICGSCSSVAFSLDLRDGVPLSGGAAGAGETPEEIAVKAASAGAEAIIVLDVARVGTGSGPDLQTVRRIRQRVSEAAVLAGGGVRNLADLGELARIGCDGALVASALHDGRLTAADVAAASRCI